MENSDDYFDDDDLILDEATEAAILASERQYATQAAPIAVPVAKKQRTTTGWAPGLGARADSLGDLDFPEITVQDNGYYASARNQPLPTPQSIPVPVPNLRHQTASRSHVPPARSNWQYPSRHVQKSTPVPQRPQTPNLQPRFPSVNRPASSSTTYASKASTSPHPLEDQVRQLNQQLEQLRQSNNEMQLALQGALGSKIAKDGEVTILRKTIEKNSQAHAEEIARMKAAKQEAEAKQIQIQKTLKEDMERLKSQLAFKQQEVLEATFKKPPGSVRPKKTYRDPPATPLPSTSGGGWNLLSQRPSFTIDAQQTPSRPAYYPPISPRKALQKSPTKSKKPIMLPGFQNSFTSSTPLRPSQLKAKGKERESFLDDANFFEPMPQSQPFPPPFRSPSKREKTERITGPSPKRAPPAPVDNIFNPQPRDDAGSVDIVMAPSQIANAEDELTEEFDIIDPPNWKAELCRIILTHICVNNSQPTFQHLLAVTFAGQDELDDSRLYTSSCIRIMNAISHPTGMEGYDQCLQDVSNSFVSIIEILSKNKLASQLANLFNLLATLVFYLPKFRSFMFGQEEANASPLIRLVCGVIVPQLTPPGSGENELGRELLSFLEAMCFELSEEESLKFTDLVRNREVMMTLLNPAQSTPFLEQVARTLVLLSTRKQLHRPLLSLLDPDQVGDASVKNGLTERLCSYLIDSTRDGPASYRLKETILTYFAQLSLAHPDAYATLSGLPVFLASVLWYIAQLAAPLWEDDERLMESPTASIELIQYTGRAIYFMHHLIFSTDPTLNLRYKLQQAPPRPFNNILQVFIVSFGRLSYAEAPDWLDEDSRNGLEEMIEMARDILELVVDGPEGDDIWHAYQDDLEDEKHLDEEEMEAQMVEAD